MTMTISGIWRNTFTVLLLAGVLAACDVYTYDEALRDWNKSHEPPPPLDPPAMVSPGPGSTFATGTQTFTWTANGATVSEWRLLIGSSAAGNDLFNSGPVAGSVLSVEVINLPTDGSLVYVRLGWTIAGTVGQADYVYTAADLGVPIPPAMVSPVPGSVLAGDAETFTWSANDAIVDEWQLLIGTNVGASDLFNSGSLAGDVLSLEAVDLPTDGGLVYVRLIWTIAGTMAQADYTYTAADEDVPPPPGNAPYLVSPLSCSVLDSGTTTFSWSPNGVMVDDWRLQIGTTSKGQDLFNSGLLAADVLSIDVSGLPTDGSLAYVRLRWTVSGMTTSADYIFRLTGQGAPPPAGTSPAIVSPMPCSTLMGSTQTFTWSANGADVEEWRLLIGTSPKGRDLFNSRALAGNVLSMDVSGLPTDGSYVFVRLRWTIEGRSRRIDYIYVASDAGGVAAMFGASLSEIKAKVFAQSCASAGCHSGTIAAAGLNLDHANSYAELVGIGSSRDRAIPRVAAGNPDGSYIIQKLEHSFAAGAPMPPGSALVQSDIDVIRQWILDGAMDDRAQSTSPIRVSSLSPMPNAILDASPVQLVAGFDRNLDASVVNLNTFILEASGGDATFGDGNETRITAASIFVPLTNPRSAVFDLTGVSLGDDTYRVRLAGSGASLIMDLGANALDGEFSGAFPTGDSAAGGDFSAQFVIVTP